MYLPFVRSKQFELLALKEMAGRFSESGQISPIIEPVRERGDALVRCLDELARFGVPVTVVVNPSVGELAKSRDDYVQVLDLLAKRQDHGATRLGVLVQASTDVAGILEAKTRAGLDDLPVDLIHDEFAGEKGLHDLVSESSYQIMAAKDVVRRYRPALPGAHVKLTERFTKRRTNLDYVGVEPTLFTDDNIYYHDDGFAGFSDFATIGREYSEGGSSPRAVVIHLTYPDPDDGTIWLRHFCSTSNDDTADTAGKFGQALEKLVSFVNEAGLSNPALDAFRAYEAQQSYPGLGMVKKLSIQNHLYLVADSLGSA